MSKEESYTLPLICQRYIDRDFCLDRTGFDPEKVQALNAYLKSLYRNHQLFLSDADEAVRRRYEKDTIYAFEPVYKDMVGFNRGESDWTYDHTQTLNDWFDRIRENKEAKYTLVNSDSFFVYVQLDRDERKYDPIFIKTYFCFQGNRFARPFLDMVRYLADCQDESFRAKITRRGRYETCMFWTSKKAYILLNQYFMQHIDLLHTPLKMIPHINNIGISKEFPDSHNRMNAEIIYKHFHGIHHEDEIDVHAVFDGFFPFRDKLEYGYDVYSQLVLFATKCLLLGKERIGDEEHGSGSIMDAAALEKTNHILLRNDDEMWMTLHDLRHPYRSNEELMKYIHFV